MRAHPYGWPRNRFIELEKNRADIRFRIAEEPVEIRHEIMRWSFE